MNKKFIFLPLVLSFVLIFSFSVNAVTIKDVPKDHWAYDSVKKLVEEGYLSLYEDGTFGGNKKVTRYELAELVARILENIDSGKAKPTEQDVSTLRKLSLEFRDELVDLAQKQKVFDQRLSQQKSNNVIQNEEIGKVNEHLDNLEKEVSNIIDNIIELKNMKNKIDQLNTRVTTLEDKVAKTNQRLDAKNQSIEEIKTQLNSDILQSIKDQNTVTQTKIHSLQSRVNKLEDKLSAANSVESKPKSNSDKTGLVLGAIALLALVAGS